MARSITLQILRGVRRAERSPEDGEVLGKGIGKPAIDLSIA